MPRLTRAPHSTRDRGAHAPCASSVAFGYPPGRNVLLMARTPLAAGGRSASCGMTRSRRSSRWRASHAPSPMARRISRGLRNAPSIPGCASTICDTRPISVTGRGASPAHERRFRPAITGRRSGIAPALAAPPPGMVSLAGLLSRQFPYSDPDEPGAQHRSEVVADRLHIPRQRFEKPALTTTIGGAASRWKLSLSHRVTNRRVAAGT